MLKPLLLTLLLIITINANESVPLIFYEDSTLEKRNYFPHKELRLQVTDKQSIVQSKFVKGFYWLAEYKFNKTTLKKFFIKKVRERVVSYGGTLYSY